MQFGSSLKASDIIAQGESLGRLRSGSLKASDVITLGQLLN
jgi:uncharacterized protein YciW